MNLGKAAPEIGAILVVDDEENVRRMVVRILQRFGFITFDAGSAQEARQIFSEHSHGISLLLTDYHMVDSDNGWTLANDLRQQRNELKIVFMSGHVDDLIAHGGKLIEGVDFVSKPFSHTTLLRAVCARLNLPLVD